MALFFPPSFPAFLKQKHTYTDKYTKAKYRCPLPKTYNPLLSFGTTFPSTHRNSNPHALETILLKPPF